MARRTLQSELRSLPSVDRILSRPPVRQAVEAVGHRWTVHIARKVLSQARQAILGGAPAPTPGELAERVAHLALKTARPSPTPVVNATGVIIHTNLGRAPLSDEALEAIRLASEGYSDLEYDLDPGTRGSRQEHVRHLLTFLTGAEDALVVNNNASAVLLALTALARGREVVVSRGEAVEIGGGFRIPEILARSGARLREVGTTNRTYARDYEQALSEETALLLKVHPSNFRISGFTHSPEVAELAEIAHRHGIPLLYDLGSGCLLDTTRFGLAREPTPQDAISQGADLVFFSGDKLLGGPQAGIVVGKRTLVYDLARHPLARAVRIDKLSLAGLTATLLHYVKEEATRKIPVWQMISADPSRLAERARLWQGQLGDATSPVPGLSTVGGGSLPGETLPTTLLALDCSRIPGGAGEVLRRLRRHTPPVIARTEDDRVVLDPRTVLPREDPIVVSAVRRALATG